MVYPENIPAGSTAFDLAATAGVQPHEVNPNAEAVQVAVARFNAYALDHGPTKAAVMLLTGLSSDEIDAVGGVS